MSGNRRIYIKAYPRIHATLIGMNSTGLRINGGIGFSIAEPFIELNIESASNFAVQDTREVPLDKSQKRRLEDKLGTIVEELGLSHNLRVVISGSMPTHSGFGSGTIIRLACIEGLLLLNNRHYDQKSLIALSGRGGTSGIGIRTYFQGGYVFDIGHRNVGQELISSSKREKNPLQTLLISEGNMPDWEIGICYPLGSIDMTKTEDQFFASNSAQSNLAVNQTLYNVVYGVLAGIKEHDRDSFENGINAIQTSEWKLSEADLYYDELHNAKKILYENGASMVGISSIGPGLFFWGPNMDRITKKSNQGLADWKFLKTITNNSARYIIIKDA